MAWWNGTTLPTSGSISLNQIHVEAGGATGTTINFNNRRIRNLTGFKKSSAGAKSFSQCRGAFMDGHPHGHRYISPSTTDFNINYSTGTYVYSNRVWEGHVGPNQIPDYSRQLNDSAAIGVGVDRALAAGNLDVDGTSTSYTNNTTLIQYIGVADWEDEGEGDYDFTGYCAAIAPGGSATIRANGNHTFSNANLAKICCSNAGGEASSWNADSSNYTRVGNYPTYSPAYGINFFSGSSTIYPWGITVD